MKKHQSIFFIASTITLTALYFILMILLGGCTESKLKSENASLRNELRLEQITHEMEIKICEDYYRKLEKKVEEDLKEIRANCK